MRPLSPIQAFNSAIWAVFYLFTLSLNDAQAQALGQPNIVLVLLDDAGYRDLSCYGSDIQTPYIDQLAAEGMRFTDAHAAAPNCSPSRAGLLTGRMPSRVGLYSYIPPDHEMRLPATEITLAHRLRDLGYRTGHFGKWHLSQLQSQQPQPQDFGFDTSLGTDNNAIPNHRNPRNFIRDGQAQGELEGYSAHIVVDATIDWIAQNPETPFFSCVWFHEPHTPIASPEDLTQAYAGRHPEVSKKRARYMANIANVDAALGRLWQALRALNLEENTLILLTSDNGPVDPISRGGLRGKKAAVYEGGHRVPTIAKWPGVIPRGVISDALISGTDVFPTVLDILEAPLPADRIIDGESFLRALRGETWARTKPLYWFFYRVQPAAAYREGDWVVIADLDDPRPKRTHQLIPSDMPYIKESPLTRLALYHLVQDPSQATDRATEEPERLMDMRIRMERLHREIVTEGPYWWRR